MIIQIIFKFNTIKIFPFLFPLRKFILDLEVLMCFNVYANVKVNALLNIKVECLNLRRQFLPYTMLVTSALHCPILTMFSLISKKLSKTFTFFHQVVFPSAITNNISSNLSAQTVWQMRIIVLAFGNCKYTSYASENSLLRNWRK